LTDGVVTALAQLVQLRRLDLRVGRIGDKGAVALAPALARLVRLRHLDLCVNRIARPPATASECAAFRHTSHADVAMRRRLANRLGYPTRTVAGAKAAWRINFKATTPTYSLFPRLIALAR
jgi:hypothetical protein